MPSKDSKKIFICPECKKEIKPIEKIKKKLITKNDINLYIGAFFINLLLYLLLVDLH